MKYGDSREQPVKDLVIGYWVIHAEFKYQGWIIDQTWTEQYSPKFIKENPDRTKDHWGHIPDLAFYEWIGDQPQLRLVIEIDGKSHSSKTRQISDKIFEKWIEQRYHGNVPVIRLDPVECLGTNEDRDTYLRDKLKDYLIQK